MVGEEGEQVTTKYVTHQVYEIWNSSTYDKCHPPTPSSCKEVVPTLDFKLKDLVPSTTNPLHHLQSLTLMSLN